MNYGKCFPSRSQQLAKVEMVREAMEFWQMHTLETSRNLIQTFKQRRDQQSSVANSGRKSCILLCDDTIRPTGPTLEKKRPSNVDDCACSHRESL